ncbi:GOLPH3/VPS74 family protein [Actinomadura fibrosa]|uniref:GPP34 family phosphoprotein n=1 Tax=Actinomadura fibrosa TaxID=111802 RepID=A0ABW2XH64_9ACTN|nr:GPP34 family phosphoprotein [Actinomadura fibrosa]
MRIADELLLLAVDPVGGLPVIGVEELDLALGAALLAELALSGRVGFAGGRVRPARTPSASGDPELDAAFAAVVRAPGGDASGTVVALSGGDLLRRLRNGLIGRGVFAEEEHWVEGVLTSSTHPELNPAPRKEILARLGGALDGSVPEPRTASLLAIAHGCGLLRVLFPAVADLDRRVSAGTGGGWEGRAVADAIARRATLS